MFAIGGVALLLVGAVSTGILNFDGSGPEQQARQSANGAAQIALPAPASTAAGPQLFQPVVRAELDRAFATLIMSDADKARVREAVTAGKANIAWINVSDSQAEDGDWVRVTAAGFSQDVRLFRNPLRVAVPYVPGTPVTVTGLIDGDGHSITVAVHFSGSIFGLKPMRKGESITVPAP